MIGLKTRCRIRMNVTESMISRLLTRVKFLHDGPAIFYKACTMKIPKMLASQDFC